MQFIPVTFVAVNSFSLSFSFRQQGRRLVGGRAESSTVEHVLSPLCADLGGAGAVLPQQSHG